MTKSNNVRSALHKKYQIAFNLSEPEMRWCERISAISLKPLTLVITQFSRTKVTLRK